MGLGVSGKPLRPYQEAAVAAVLDEWTRVRSTLLVSATGCGKSRMAAEIVKRHGCRALWIAHREELLEQAAETLRAEGMTTDLERAESRAAVHDLFGGAEVVVASVATLHARRLARWPRNTFSVIVVDEAHHATAAGYRQILDHFADAKVLGLTATPDRGDGTALGNIFQSCAFRYDILDGIRGGYLAPIRARKIVCGSLDLRSVRATAGDLNAADLERVMKVDGVLHQIASPLFQEAESRPTIVFVPTVALAEELARVLAGYAPGRVACISANTPRETRARILDGYRAGRVQFVTNVGVLTEGFDAPATSCIAMARPTRSRALYAQCVGRGTRIAPGKDCLLLLDFCAANGSPDLVGPADVLAGKLDDEARAEVERRLTTGTQAEELDGLIAEAKEVADRIEAEKAAERDRQRLQVVIPYARRDMEVFPQFAALAKEAATTFTPGAAAPTEKQRAFLGLYGIAVPEGTSGDSVGEMIASVRRRNMPTIRQARRLAQNGLRTDITRAEADAVMTALANNGWRVPPAIRERFAEQAA